MVGLLLKKKPDVTNRWKNPTTATYFRGIGADGKVGEIESKNICDNGHSLHRHDSCHGS